MLKTHKRNFTMRWVLPNVSLVIISCMSLSLSLLLFSPSDAFAAEPSNSPDDESSPWLPSAEFGISFDREKRKAETVGTIAPESGKSEDHLVSIRFGGQIQAPEVESFWGKPRPFASAGLLFVVANHRIEGGDFTAGGPDAFLQSVIELEETPSDPNATGDALRALDPSDIPGSGFLVDHRTNPNPGAYAVMGLAFTAPLPVDLPGWVSIRPSIEYNLRNYRLTGTGFDVQEPIPDTFEVTRNYDTRSFSEHRLGPALEFELGFGSEKSFGMSFLVAARWLYIVSDDEQTWGDRSTISSSIYDETSVLPIPETSSAGKVFGFRTEADSLVFSLGAGIRIYWY